jgi:sulfoxide reductase heme-binding subunit YedZ
LGIVHTIIGLCVHLRGRPWLYFVYSQGEGKHPVPLRHDLFGFANDTGALAIIVLLLLLATSNDFAPRSLSTLRWKQLQLWNYPFFCTGSSTHCSIPEDGKAAPSVRCYSFGMYYAYPILAGMGISDAP